MGGDKERDDVSTVTGCLESVHEENFDILQDS